MKEWGSFEQAEAMVVDKSIEFAGRIFKPNRKLAYVKASLCHPLPVLNLKKRGFTAATLANSFGSAVMQMFDFEHALEFYGAEKDMICGAIAAAEFPSKKKAMELADAGEKVPMEILFALWRKAAGVEEALEEMATKKNPWRTSMECEWPSDTSAMWDGSKFINWDECSSEMKACIKPNTVEKFGGKQLALIMGGEDGEVLFTGGALTKWPADKDADLAQVAASNQPERVKGSVMVQFGWKSADDWRQAVASNKAVIKSETAALIIGKTSPGEDGHTHDITRHLQVMPTKGHSHYFNPVDFNPETGSLEGITSNCGSWSGGNYMEHNHQVILGGSADGTGSSTGSSPIIEPPKFNADDIKALKNLKAVV